MSAFETEREHEQHVVDLLYSRLDELRGRARSRLTDVRRSGSTGTPQNRSERDAFATLYEDRAAQLDAVEDRLVFGRLDLDPATLAKPTSPHAPAAAPAPQPTPQPAASQAHTPSPTALPPAPLPPRSRYIGRLALSDENHQPLLTDWRAPAAEAFYRATALEPDGVIRRRHLVTSARRVTGIEDELLDITHASDHDGSLSGEGALFASLAQRRTGQMSDIVATIQAEQDRIIRSDLTGALVVQGGPGTGKTAVALHRAAYLLYAHRRMLEKSGILLVGPSLAFLRYIDQVLPSLGETGVVSTTIGDLLPGIHAIDDDSASLAAEIKGRLIWADIIRRAVRARQRIPAQDIPFTLDGYQLAIRPHDVRDAISKARRSHKPHNQARVHFVRDMLSKLANQYAHKARRSFTPEDRAIIMEDLRAHRDVRVALNLAWFPLSAKRLVDDLFAKPHRLEEVAWELTAQERAALHRPKFAPWTSSDVPLLDEACELLGEDDTVARAEEKAREEERREALDHARSVLASGAAGGMIPIDAQMLADRFTTSSPRMTTAERAAADRTWTYGHVIVDEAQELSPMAWRMLARRVPTRSMTIVGDVAQTAALGGARSWQEALDPVMKGTWRIQELTVSYRTPAAVADAASRMAHHAGLPVSPLTAAREVADAVTLVPVPAVAQAQADAAHTSDAQAGDVQADDAQAGTGAQGQADAALHEVLCDQLAALIRDFVDADGTGRVAVIAASSQLPALRRLLSHALVDMVGQAEAHRLQAQQPVDAQVPVLSPQDVKGLEYDAVLLVEPALIAEQVSGWSNLYVAMTRPTQRLVVVHSRALPEGFTSAT